MQEKDFVNIWGNEEYKQSFFPKEQLLKHFQFEDNPFASYILSGAV